MRNPQGNVYYLLCVPNNVTDHIGHCQAGSQRSQCTQTLDCVQYVYAADPTLASAVQYRRPPCKP